MRALLVTSRMNPALAARVEASVVRSRAPKGSGRPRAPVLRVVLVLILLAVTLVVVLNRI